MRIGFCGTQSVGKSTLVKALKEEPKFENYKFFTERSKEIASKGVKLNHESNPQGQSIFFFERIMELLEANMLADRTFIDVLAFTNLIPLTGNKEEDLKISRFKEFAESLFSTFIKNYDLIFYIPTEIDLEDNGIRDINPDFRYKIDKEIRRIIQANFIMNKVKYISGSVENRVNKVLEAVSGYRR